MNSKINCYIQSLNLSETSPVVIIEKITKENGIFNFVQLLDNEKIYKLKENSTDIIYYNLLYLFCYGTYKEYVSNSQLYPFLNDEQLRKLKQLTIISLSMTDGVLYYKDIYEATGENCQKKIEELILDLIYYNIIEGYFDQENECFQVASCSGRDFPIEQIGEMRSKLVDWAKKCDSVIERLTFEFTAANNIKAQKRVENQQATINLEKAREEISQVIKKEMSAQNNLDKSRNEVYGNSTPNKESCTISQESSKKKTLLRNLKKK